MTPNQNPTATPTETPIPQNPPVEAPAVHAPEHPAAPKDAQIDAAPKLPIEQAQVPTMAGSPVVLAPQTEPAKTTLGNRISTGLVNGAAYGGLAIALTAAVSSARKIFNKANAANIKWLPKTGLYISAGVAAVVGVLSALTANRGREAMGNDGANLQGEPAITAQEQAMINQVANNPALKQRAEAAITQWQATSDPAAKQAIVDHLMTDLDALTAKENTPSTKYRDAVAESRGVEHELGA